MKMNVLVGREKPSNFLTDYQLASNCFKTVYPPGKSGPLRAGKIVPTSIVPGKSIRFEGTLSESPNKRQGLWSSQRYDLYYRSTGIIVH
jgi:hypothetical protein